MPSRKNYASDEEQGPNKPKAQSPGRNQKRDTTEDPDVAELDLNSIDVLVDSSPSPVKGKTPKTEAKGGEQHDEEVDKAQQVMAQMLQTHELENERQATELKKRVEARRLSKEVDQNP